MKKFWEKLKICFPLYTLIFFGIAVVALVIELLSKTHIGLADGVNDTSGVVIRTILAKLTSWIPFSLAETALLLSPALVAWVIVAMIRRGKKGKIYSLRYFVSFLSVLSLVYATFVFGYGTGYYGKTIDQKLGMPREKVSAGELYDTAIVLAEHVHADLDEIYFPTGTYSSMPFDNYRTLSKKLSEAYDELHARYPVVQKMHSSVKPVALSEPWTYTHLSGVYCFFSGEANININYPDYIVVSSAAHEMAHQRGICREDEANFVAFLVCSMSDDPYIRYSGYMDVLETVLNKLYSASPDLYRTARAQIDQKIFGEYAAFSAFFDQYRENVAANVTNTVNNTYIEIHGQPDGVQSYGLVTDLVVSYMLYGTGAQE